MKFKNELFSNMATQLGVEYKLYTHFYHLQSNWKIEGFHVLLKACISKHVSGTLGWDQVVPLSVQHMFFAK